MRRKLAWGGLVIVLVVVIVASVLTRSMARRVTPQAVLDAAINIVRTHALHAKEVDWATEEPKIRAMAVGAKDTRDVYPAIRTMLKLLGDHHSYLLVPAKAERMKTTGKAMSQPEVVLEAGSIGYVHMPGFSGTDTQAGTQFSAGIRTKIENLAAQVHCGWIVDLRNDTGGNMWPMLQALEPFLDGQKLGAFAFVDGHVKPWEITPHTDGDKNLPYAKVAVLTGPHTTSSGEAVAVAFRGRDNTRSFGSPTHGLSTANGSFDLPDGSRVQLTVAVDQDRDGHRYGDKIEPDQTVDASGSEGDATLTAASQWLGKSCPAGK
jgi:C-terminal processing protease CtpA/Prc